MSNINPYASPKAPFFEPQPVALQPIELPVGVFRQGNIVVMHRSATLPNICFFRGEPTNGDSLSWTLQYIPPWLRGDGSIPFLPNPVFETVTVHIPLSEATLRARWRWTWFWIGLALLGMLVIAGGLVGLSARQWEANLWATVMLIGAALIVISPIFPFFVYERVNCHFMDEHYIWITAAHQNFLAPLPHWPYSPR